MFGYELKKVVADRFLQGVLLVLVLVNAFSLWHFTPDLGPARRFNAHLNQLEPQERLAYVAEVYEQISGLLAVEGIQHLLSFSHQSELIANYIEQRLGENPELLERFLPIYVAGDFQLFSDSLQSEADMVRDFYEEFWALALVMRNLLGASSLMARCPR